MALFKAKISLEPALMDRIRTHVEETGYSSAEEFVSHCVEKELQAREESQDEVLKERLRGLGYIE